MPTEAHGDQPHTVRIADGARFCVCTTGDHVQVRQARWLPEDDGTRGASAAVYAGVEAAIVVTADGVALTQVHQGHGEVGHVGRA